MRTMGQFTRFSICLALLVLSTGCRASNGWVMNNSGMGYYQKGNYAMARQEFARAIADDPYHPDYRHNLAMAMQKQGDLPGAERVMRHTLSIDPMHQPTYHALAQSLMLQQRPDEAQELLVGWAETQPYATSSHVEMAWLQRELGNTTGAEQSLRQALQVEPNNPIALAHLGQVHHDAGRPDQAAAYYERSLASQWDQPEVHSRLATVSSRRDVRRSAMMHNTSHSQPNTFASGPISLDQSTFAAMPLEDPVDTRRLTRRDRRHQHGTVAGGYPLPTYGTQTALWSPTGTAMSQPMMSQPMMSYQQPMLADQQFVEQPYTTRHPAMAEQIMLPGTIMGSPVMTTQSIYSAPGIASGSSIIPQADPAHATGTVAGLPVVSPY